MTGRFQGSSTSTTTPEGLTRFVRSGDLAFRFLVQIPVLSRLPRLTNTGGDPWLISNTVRASRRATPARTRAATAPPPAFRNPRAR